MDSQFIHFSIIDYFNYLEGNKHSRRVYEGEEVLNAGHIILCGVTGKSQDKINISSLCLQTSALNNLPHSISGSFKIEDNKVNVLSIECSCKAGKSGKCKHISATLLFCTKTPLDKLEEISQTDLQCIWSVQKNRCKENYKAVNITNMPCFKKKVKKQVQLNLDTKNKEHIQVNMNLLKQSALYLHRMGRVSSLPTLHNTNITDNEELYITNVLNNSYQSILMLEMQNFNIHDCGDCEKVLKKFGDTDPLEIAQKTHSSQLQWIDQRKYRMTGSRVYEIYTYKRKNWSNKVKAYFDPKPFSNKYVRHGITEERNARQVFAEKTGFCVKEMGLIISYFNPWLGYTPDGIIFNDDKPSALLEIKCPYLGSTKSLCDVLPTLDYLKFEDETFSLKKFHKYNGQIQTGMALLNIDLCYFCIYCSYDQSMLILPVNFDYHFCKDLLFKTKQKYFVHLLHAVSKTIT